METIKQEYLGKNGKLLTINGNAKIQKESGGKHLSAIMHLQPDDEICDSYYRKFCSGPCLYSAGRGKFSNVKQARINRTRFYKENRDYFMMALNNEISKFTKYCNLNQLKPCIRLNGTSDVPFESVKYPYSDKTVFDLFPYVTFYDYTKRIERLISADYRLVKKNYHLTFSYSGNNKAQCLKALDLGFNVSIVLVPSLYQSMIDANHHIKPFKITDKLIDGEKNDHRFLEGYQSAIIALKAKGQALKAKNNPFIVGS